MPEAPLQESGSGLAPTGPGWFVVNVRDAMWLTTEGGEKPRSGSECSFETPMADFEQVGVRIHVLPPGEPNGCYHAESQQEDFLVLSGECTLLVEGEERPLAQWDLFHSPPGTEHVLVGTSDEACIVLRVGTRLGYPGLFYPRDEVAVRHGAATEQECSSGAEAYASRGHWQPGEKPAGVL